MKKNILFTRVVLISAALLFIVASLSSVFHPHTHVCGGQDCPLCKLAERGRGVFILVAVAFGMVLPSCRLLSAISPNLCRADRHTSPVKARVKLIR